MPVHGAAQLPTRKEEPSASVASISAAVRKPCRLDDWRGRCGPARRCTAAPRASGPWHWRSMVTVGRVSRGMASGSRRPAASSRGWSKTAYPARSSARRPSPGGWLSASWNSASARAPLVTTGPAYTPAPVIGAQWSVIRGEGGLDPPTTDHRPPGGRGPVLSCGHATASAGGRALQPVPGVLRHPRSPVGPRRHAHGCRLRLSAHAAQAPEGAAADPRCSGVRRRPGDLPHPHGRPLQGPASAHAGRPAPAGAARAGSPPGPRPGGDQ